jgi:hypothetical protein
MQRLPSINPGDSSAYPDGLGTFDIGAAGDGSKILLKNFSPLNLDLDFLNGSTDMLHAWEANWWRLDGDTKQIEWLIDADSLNVSAPPISAVFMTLYDANEQISGTYPVFASIQTSIGNPGGTPSAVTSLQNTGNPAGTNVVSVGSTGAAGTTWTASNDGLWVLAVTIAAALVQVLKTNEADPILQLGAAAHLVEVLGNLNVDGTLKVTNAPQLTAKKIQDGSGNVLADWSGAGLAMNGNPASLKYFGYGRDQTHEDFHMGAVSLTAISFSGNGTFNHNCTEAGSGVVPDEPWHNPYSGAPPGSQTMGFQSFTTTTIFITTGASLAGKVHMWVHA